MNIGWRWQSPVSHTPPGLCDPSRTQFTECASKQMSRILVAWGRFPLRDLGLSLEMKRVALPLAVGSPHLPEHSFWGIRVPPPHPQDMEVPMQPLTEGQHSSPNACMLHVKDLHTPSLQTAPSTEPPWRAPDPALSHLWMARCPAFPIQMQSHLKKFSAFFVNSSHPQAWATTAHFSVSISLPFPECHINGIIYYVGFDVFHLGWCIWESSINQGVKED